MRRAGYRLLIGPLCEASRTSSTGSGVALVLRGVPLPSGRKVGINDDLTCGA